MIFQHGQKSRGLDYFSAIKLPSIALVLTTVIIIFCFPVQFKLTYIEVEFCIEEWSTGLFIKNDFDKAKNLPWYIDHFLRLVEWCSLKPMVVDKFLQKKYDCMWCVHVSLLLIWCSQSLRKSVGIVLIMHPPVKLTDAAKEAAMKELEGCTGNTDSEIEGLDV